VKHNIDIRFAKTSENMEEEKVMIQHVAVTALVSVSADSWLLILLIVWYWGINGCVPTSFGNERESARDSAHLSLRDR